MRGIKAFHSVEDVWRRAGVPVAALTHIAAADGFQGLGVSRREAIWAIKGLHDEALPLFAAADDRAGHLQPESIEPPVTLPAMTAGREVVEDYRSTGLSLRGQPTCWNAPLSSDVCTAKPPAHDDGRAAAHGVNTLDIVKE